MHVHQFSDDVIQKERSLDIFALKQKQLSPYSSDVNCIKTTCEENKIVTSLAWNLSIAGSPKKWKNMPRRIAWSPIRPIWKIAEDILWLLDISRLDRKCLTEKHVTGSPENSWLLSRYSNLWINASSELSQKVLHYLRTFLIAATHTHPPFGNPIGLFFCLFKPYANFYSLQQQKITCLHFLGG